MFYLKHGMNVATLGKAYAQKSNKNNFIYKQFQYKKLYLYKRFWLMQESEKYMCKATQDL
jgi:hypothetical protein